MEKDNSSTDMFCRMNVNSTLDHRQLAEHLAAIVNGDITANLVTSNVLDLMVDRNDNYQVDRTNEPDGWLYYVYTIEIDPAKQVHLKDYIDSIDKLLRSCWELDIDAHAICDFEDQLPRR